LLCRPDFVYTKIKNLLAAYLAKKLLPKNCKIDFLRCNMSQSWSWLVGWSWQKLEQGMVCGMVWSWQQ
jgi:hypothetical protein